MGNETCPSRSSRRHSDRSCRANGFCDAFSHSRRTAENRLRHAWYEEHIHDKSDKYHDAGNEIRKPHLHRIISIEGLLDKGIHESAPYEDEGSGDGPNHGESDEYVKKVKELRSDRLRH